MEVFFMYLLGVILAIMFVSFFCYMVDGKEAFKKDTYFMAVCCCCLSWATAFIGLGLCLYVVLFWGVTSIYDEIKSHKS